MSKQVLHLDFISLSPDSTPAQRDELVDTAASLAVLDQVVSIGVIEGQAGSDFDLAFAFLLRDFLALEPFGTDPRYSRFLQGTVAPILKAFSGADVQLSEDLDFANTDAACLALAAPDETYDWEISEVLEAWLQALEPARACVGLATGEKQRYRGAAIALGGKSLQARGIESTTLTSSTVCGQARRLL